jgi:hypothetical protein
VLREVCHGIGASTDAAWLETVGRPEGEVRGESEGSATGDARHTKRPDYEGAVSGASVGRWREDLSADEQREVERLCGPRLSELGYEA